MGEYVGHTIIEELYIISLRELFKLIYDQRQSIDVNDIWRQWPTEQQLHFPSVYILQGSRCCSDLDLSDQEQNETKISFKKMKFLTIFVGWMLIVAVVGGKPSVCSVTSCLTCDQILKTYEWSGAHGHTAYACFRLLSIRNCCQRFFGSANSWMH